MFKYLLAGFLITGCSFNKIERYKDTKPEFNFEQFFDGKLTGYGSVFDFFGRLDARFIIKSEKINNPNYANDGKVLYKQSIEYLDSKKKKEMISYAIFDKNNKKSLIYKDEMMVKPSKYELSGNAAHIQYDLKLDGRDMIVFADDWSYMIDEKHAVNKVKIKKFGITVAYIIMHIVKEN